MAMTVVDKDCTKKAECFVNTVAEANYERGFKDGYAKAIEEFTEKVVAELENIKTGGDCRHKCKHYDWSVGWCEGHCEDYVRDRAISIVRGKE